jgi:hypothetical protein
MRDPEDICPVCGILTHEELNPAAYEVLWDVIPALRDAQEAGQRTYCPECSRQLTFFRARGEDDTYWLNVQA